MHPLTAEETSKALLRESVYRLTADDAEITVGGKSLHALMGDQSWDSLPEVLFPRRVCVPPAKVRYVHGVVGLFRERLSMSNDEYPFGPMVKWRARAACGLRLED
jgi:hypothetical protein